MNILRSTRVAALCVLAVAALGGSLASSVFAADGEGTAALWREPMSSGGMDFNGNPSGNLRWVPEIHITMPVTNQSGGACHYRWTIECLTADNSFAFVDTTFGNISIVENNTTGNASGAGDQIFRFVGLGDTSGAAAYPTSPVIGTGQTVEINARVRAKLLNTVNGRTVFSRILTFKWTVTAHNDVNDRNFRIRASASLPAFVDSGAAYQEPPFYEVSFPNRNVPATGGMLQGTVYCTVQNSPFSFASGDTSWITAQDGGTNFASQPSMYNGLAMFAGLARFDVAAHPNMDYSQWYDARQGSVTIQGQDFDITQESAGYRFKEAAVRDSKSRMVAIAFEKGEQNSSGVYLEYRLNGGAFVPIPPEQLLQAEEDLGNGVVPGIHNLTWDASSLVDASDKKLSIELKVADLEGFSATSAPFTLEPSCDGCKECAKPGAVAAATTGSIEVTVSLGSDAQARGYGRLRIHQEAASDQLASPLSLLRETYQGAQTLPAALANFTQILTGAVLVEINDPDPNDNTWNVCCYDRGTALGSFNAGTGLYDQTGKTPFQTVTFTVAKDAAGAFQTFTVEESGVYGNRQHLFTWAPDAQGNPRWLLDQIDPIRGLLLRESVVETTSPDGLIRNTDRQIFEPGGTTLTDRRITTEQKFAFGERVTKEEQFVVRENGTVAGSRSTFHTYHSTAGQPGYGLTAETFTDYDGSWTSYSYNADGLAEIRRPYRNAGRGSDPAQLDVTTMTWETGEFGLGPAQDLAKITTHTLAGQAVSRTVDVFFRDELSGTLSDGQSAFTYEEQWSIELTDPAVTTVAGALASNTALVTKSRTYASGPFEGQTRSVLRPDGTITLFEYDGSETITWSGAADANGHSISAGTRQSRVVNEYGQLVSSQTVDLTSQLVIEEQLALAHDSLGRPTEIQHLGGARTYASYTCCGLESETDREGITTTYARDMLGRVHSQTRLGITTTYTLSALGAVRSVTETAGGSTLPRSVTHSDNLGVEVTSIDAMHRSTSTVETFAASGARILTTTNPDGSTRVETFYLDGSPFTVTGTGAHPIKYEYGTDAGGRFTKTIRLGDGGQETEWTTAYTDFAGRASKTVQAHESGTPAVSTNFYNAKSQLVRTVDPDGVTSLLESNDLGEQVASAVDVDQNGAIDRGGEDRVTETGTSYATRGGKTVRRSVEQGYITPGNATPVELRVTESSVDGLDTWITVAGLTTHRATQLLGNGNSTHTVTNPDGTKEVTQVTGGWRSSVARLDATGAQVTQTSYTYDPFGRVASQTDARTGTTTFTWFDDGQMASTVTAGQTTSFTYDAHGRPDLTTLPDGGVVDQDYSSTGNLLHQEGARTYPVTYTYDSQGRLRTMTTAGGVTTWNYHAASGRLAQKIHGDGHGPAYTYTPAGRVQTRNSGRGITTAYAYNGAGDLAGIDYSDDTPDVAYSYTRRGQAASVTRGGSSTAYAYNLAGALEQEQVAGGVLDAVIVDPAYDALLRRTTLNATGPGWGYQQSYAYDQAGRLGTIASGNQSISYGYVPNSNLLATSQSATGGNTVLTTTRTWDNLNRLTAIANVATGLNQTFAYQYNDANQRTQVTREDGASWDYGYDALGQVTGAVQKQPGGTPVAARSFGYAYDAIGTRTSASFSGATGNTHTIGYAKATGDGTQYASITHPGAAVVTGEADPAAVVTVNGAAPQARQSSYFAHELSLNNANGPAAQAVEISATLGAATETEQRHAFVPAATANLTYDEDGNLTFDGFLEYTWDAENRLITVRTRPGLAPAGFSLKDFRQVMVYDHAGRRIRRSTYYTIGGTEHRATDDLFVYDGWNQIAVLDAGTRLPRQTYVWGLDLSGTLQGAGGVGGLALITDIPSQTSHFVSYDGNGNVMGLADAVTGQQTADYVYDAFGNLLAAKGTFAMRNPWRFSTKVQDEGSGLYYYGFRYYDPCTGRWVSRDPIEEEGGIHLYLFVDNNTVAQFDRLGLVGNTLVPDPAIIRLAWEIYVRYGVPERVGLSNQVDKDLYDHLVVGKGVPKTLTQSQLSKFDFRLIDLVTRTKGKESGKRAEFIGRLKKMCCLQENGPIPFKDDYSADSGYALIGPWDALIDGSASLVTRGDQKQILFTYTYSLKSEEIDFNLWDGDVALSYWLKGDWENGNTDALRDIVTGFGAAASLFGILHPYTLQFTGGPSAPQVDLSACCRDIQ